MAGIVKVQYELNGWDGSPGINSWYFTPSGVGVSFEDVAEAGASLVHDFYTTLVAYWAAGVTAALLPVFRAYEHTTGELLEAGGLTALDPVVSTGSAAASDQSRASQAKLQFVTDQIRGNRVLRGGIYFGPINGNAIEGDGTLEPDFKTAVGTAVEGMLDLLGNTRLVVWGQPFERPLAPGSPDTEQVPGAFGHVQSVGVADKPAILRSRRD